MSEELMAIVEIGEAARKFKESDLGKCVLGMAAQDAERAAADLGNVNPSDQAKIAELQRDYKTAISLEGYLMNLISDADQSLALLTTQNEN